jgi:23S rRNA pseudouridine1911/1915/1917 synthase
MKIAYENDRVVVVDKDEGVSSEDVAAALGKKLVHRLDKCTSGLLIVADDARTVARLQRALREGRVARGYVFVAHGAVDEGVRETTLVRDRGDGLRGSGPGGKPARLEIHNVVVRPDGTSCGAVTLVTGRTHQIRIQLAEDGHPVVGERVYVRDARARGMPLLPSPRLLLHAARLRFVHPGKDKAVVDVTAPLPAGFHGG